MRPPQDEVKSDAAVTAVPRVIVLAPPIAPPASDAVLLTAALFDSPPSSLTRAVSSVAEREPAVAAPAPTSQSDAVLANAFVVNLAEINLGDRLAQLLSGDELQRRFEEIQRRALGDIESRRETLSTSIVATGTLSIGYVVWLIRGGVLMSSMLSALPAWQMVDPLPVLATRRKQRAGDPAAKADEGDVERLFDENTDSRAQAAQPAKLPFVLPAAGAPQRLPQPADETAGMASVEDSR